MTAATPAAALTVAGFGGDPAGQVFTPGRLNVVLGRGGAGKTALCRVIAGLDAAPDVTVRHGAVDLHTLAPGRRGVGLVFGEFVNYPGLSVFDNIASPVRARGGPAGAVEATVSRIAATLGLDGLLDRLPEQLSGGQQQRVALARAMAGGQRLLLLDEPLVNLDYKLRERMIGEFRALLASGDTVVIHTTSDPREALALADQLFLLDRGRWLQAGAPIELLRRPASLAAADLLADPGINRLACRVDADGRARLEAGADGLPLRLPAPAAAHWLALRPDQLALDDDDDDDAPADTPAPLAFAATVELAETNGADTFLHVRVHGAAWVAAVRGVRLLAPGSAIVLRADPADLCWFDAQGAALDRPGTA